MNAHRPTISAVVAMSENRVIGVNNTLPWHLPADLKHFKSITTGHWIVMGRKTHESIGKPLPNRTNVILTHDDAYLAPGCLVCTSLTDILAMAQQNNCPEIFIIGGATLYTQFLPLIDRIYLTIIHHTFEGDTFFPELNSKEWKETERIQYSADEGNGYPYSFCLLEREKM